MAGETVPGVREELKKANDMAEAYLNKGDHSVAAVEAVLTSIDAWPTQLRPNVVSDGRPVPGMCFGVVNVRGGGMQLSLATRNWPGIAKLVVAFAVKTIPKRHGEVFPFSSIQINYNYGAEKHVDGNNIGPSYILSMGTHQGGALWVADTFIEKDGMMRGGGGEAIVECRGKWSLFNGNAEHATKPFKALQGKPLKRISLIAFTHSSYLKLPEDVAKQVAKLGFTAGSSNGEELAFFRSFRLDRVELDGEALEQYHELQNRRKAASPPPTTRGRVALECNGYTAGRGAGWISFARGPPNRGSPQKRQKTVVEDEEMVFELPEPKNHVSVRDVHATMTGAGVVTIELPKNRTGLWIVALDHDAQGLLDVVALERFDIYKDTKEQTRALFKWVSDLPEGRVCLISITDTAMAKTRPLGEDVYAALRKLGAPRDMEKIGYRMPFGLIGIKGLKPGEGLCLLEKTKVIIRLEANVARPAGDNMVGKLTGFSVEKTDITEHILQQQQKK